MRLLIYGGYVIMRVKIFLIYVVEATILSYSSRVEQNAYASHICNMIIPYVVFLYKSLEGSFLVSVNLF